MKKENNDVFWLEQTEFSKIVGKQKALLNNPGNTIKRNAIFNLLKSTNKLGTSPKILDIGGGLGDIALDFFQRGYSANYFLLDISKIALLESKSTLQNLTCEIIQADAQYLPLSSNNFDIVICSECIEHLSNDLVAFKEMTRILKNNGIIIITIPYLEKILAKGHLRRYDFDSFVNLCINSNLDIKCISFNCRTIFFIRNLFRKLMNRQGMGEKEGTFYSNYPTISKILVLFLTPIDNIVAKNPIFRRFFKVFNEATLIACLSKI